MSMNIDSKLNNENGFWDVSLQGEDRKSVV